MLVEQTIEKLVEMRLHGMAAALLEWMEKPKDNELAPADLVGLLADAEWVYRVNAKLKSRLRNAKLKQPARIEDIDYAHARGLTKSVMLGLRSTSCLSAPSADSASTAVSEKHADGAKPAQLATAA